MTAAEIAGLALMAVGLFHILPALLTGKIPARWPVAPLTKENKPTEYKITFAVFTVVVIAGAILVVASMLVRLANYVQGV